VKANPNRPSKAKATAFTTGRSVQPIEVHLSMLLTPDEAHLFFKLHWNLMFFVNLRLNLLPDKIMSVGASKCTTHRRFKASQGMVE